MNQKKFDKKCQELVAHEDAVLELAKNYLAKYILPLEQKNLCLDIWLTWTNWWVCYKNRNNHTDNNNSGNGGRGRGRGRYISVAARWRNLVYNCYVLLPENTKRIWQQNKLLAPYLGNK